MTCWRPMPAACCGDILNDGVQDGVRRLAVGMGVEVEDDAVAQHGARHMLHVVDRKMIAAAHQRQHAPAFHQRLRAARRTAVADVLARQFVRFLLLRLRGHHQLDGVLLHMRRHQHLAAHRAHFHDGVAVEHRTHLRLLPLNGALHDAVQFRARGIGHQDLHQEAVELGFGQRIGAFHLDGILGGHHQEGTFELVRGSAAGDGALLHGFEQRGLRLGRGAVDFVGQHQVGENRAGLEAQQLGAAVVWSR